jgi:hypothetical protein
MIGILLGDSYATLSSHATHVSGIIMSVGIDSKSKGMPIRDCKTFYWDSDILEMAALLQMDFSLKSFLWLYYKWAGKLAFWRI